MKVKLLDLQAKFTSDVTTIKLELTPDELAKLTLADGEAVYKPADKETRPWRKNTCTDCPVYQKTVCPLHEVLYELHGTEVIKQCKMKSIIKKIAPK